MSMAGNMRDVTGSGDENKPVIKTKHVTGKHW